MFVCVDVCWCVCLCERACVCEALAVVADGAEAPWPDWPYEFTVDGCPDECDRVDQVRLLVGVKLVGVGGPLS